MLDQVSHLAQHEGLGNLDLVPGHHGLGDGILQRAPVLGLAAGLEPLPDLVLERGQGVELAHRLGQLVVERREDLLLDLAHLDGGHPRLAAQRLVPVVVGEADIGGALAPALSPITASSTSRITAPEPMRKL